MAAYANGCAVEFRVMPSNREGDWCAPKDTKIVAVARVFPHVVSIHNQIFAEGLLEARVELVSLARTNRRKRLRASQIKDIINHRDRGPLAREHQVLVERRFLNARVRDPKNGVRFLDIVGDAHAGLRLRVVNNSAVQVRSKSYVEGPVAFVDRVLNIEGNLLDVRAAPEGEQANTRVWMREIKGKKVRAGCIDGLIRDRVEARSAGRIRQVREERGIGCPEV